jgi:hypothetical protein
MAVTLNLSTYIAQTRRLLHDANANFWTDSDLTSYINDARLKVVMDTGALRLLQSFTLTASVESYSYTALPTQQVLDILGITILWGNTRYPLGYRAFSELSAQFRPYQGWTQMPMVFSVYGQNTFYVGPAPDQAYTAEIDTILAPNALVDDSTVEQILYPYTEPVPYWAARMAKLNKQSFQEAAVFEQLYRQRVFDVLHGSFTRRLRGIAGGN